jgi:hypothetical protein
MVNNPERAKTPIAMYFRLSLKPEKKIAKMAKKVTRPLCPPEVRIKTTSNNSPNLKRLVLRYLTKKKYPEGINTIKNEEKV